MRIDYARNRLLIVLSLLSMSGLLAVYVVLLTFWVNLADFAVVLTGWLTTAKVQHRNIYVQATCDFCFIASISSLVDAFTPFMFTLSDYLFILLQLLQTACHCTIMCTTLREAAEWSNIQTAGANSLGCYAS